MKRLLIAALAATTALTGVSAAGVATAQPRHYDRDHDGVPNRYDRHDDRFDRRGDRRDDWGRQHGWRYYGGGYGWDGYRGRWREGQRYSHWRDRRYVIEDYHRYHLPPPRPGYRYYRDDNGDVVMAAIASGVIGMIIGGALAH